jgi:hypothetical protein
MTQLSIVFPTTVVRWPIPDRMANESASSGEIVKLRDGCTVTTYVTQLSKTIEGAFDRLIMGFQNQRWRAAVRPQHAAAHLHRPGSVAVPRSVGCGRDVERRVPDHTERSRSCQRWGGHRPEAGVARQISQLLSMMESAVEIVMSVAVFRTLPRGWRRITSCTPASIVATTIRATKARR